MRTRVIVNQCQAIYWWDPMKSDPALAVLLAALPASAASFVIHGSVSLSESEVNLWGSVSYFFALSSATLSVAGADSV